VKAIIFDMDGVLTDSEPLIAEAAIRMFEEKGHTVRADDFHPFVGAGENRYIGGVAEKHGIPLDIPSAKQRMYEIYLGLAPGRLKSFPGAVELVRHCRTTGFAVAVASSADRIKVEANLRLIALPTPGWNAVIAAEDVARPKPEPDIFLAAAARMGVRPDECVVVEDAPNGIRAARAAGMTCFAVAHTFPPDRLREAHRVFRSISGISVADLVAGAKGSGGSVRSNGCVRS
jgi:HAD superfamily hydrolase (TIGR01509 family)